MAARIVSVFGATGTQGGSVVKALLRDGTFTPRAITRNVDSEATKKLQARGVEVVKADPLDKASLVSALRGSEAVFMITVPMMPVDGVIQDESTQGKNIAEVAKEVGGVKFIVYTSLPSIKQISGGKYPNCFQYEYKAAVEEHIRTTGIPHAFLHLGTFLENYWKFGLLKKTPTGFNVAAPRQTPKDIAAFTWVEREVPAATLAILHAYLDKGDASVVGKTYPLVTEALSYADLAKRTGDALGAEVTFTTAPDTGLIFRDDMYTAHAEYSGLYTATPVPNPDVIALGVKFGTIAEFLEQEVKPRFGSN